ncbi:MAG: hypothetical protein L3J69_05860 [Desulfobacula sp.]|nr:hypothetical protein [Desulfobacula sp.]
MLKKFKTYLNTLSRINDLGKGNPVQWHFHCGMLFLTKDKWWGDFKVRNCVHEGIDITYYKTAPGKWQQLNETIMVPAMESGIVLNICDDFLGKTIIIQPFLPVINSEVRILFVYAHIEPMNDIQKDSIVFQGSCLATLSHTKKNPQLPPHLHLSCFEVPKSIRAKDLNWNLFSKPDVVRLIHPVFL